MYKTAEEQKLEDESTKFFYMNKVIDDIKVKQQNGRLWTPYHDMQLYEYVIKYNFNFYEISNAFQRLCTNDKKYEYSEDAVRLHWAFLHSMRHFDQTPDEAYYQRMKLQYDKEKPTFKKRVEEKEEIKLSEEEDIKKMKNEFEQIMKEKYDKEKDKENKDNEEIINENTDNDKIKKIELDKKEQEEVEELINESKRKKEENDNKEKKEEVDSDNKEEEKPIEEKKEDNKLFDENNEPSQNTSNNYSINKYLKKFLIN